MALILPSQSLVLNAYAVLVGETPGNTAFVAHQSYIAAYGEDGYKTALNSIFSSYSNATLGATLLTNLGLVGIFTQSQAEAYLAAYASNRVGAMIDLANQLYNYSGSNAQLLAAKAAYVASINNSYTYSSDPDNISGAPIDTLADFTLTTGNDDILGSLQADTIIGNSTTFNAGDMIDADGGIDTLKLVLNEADTTYAGVSVSNVEKLEVRAIAAASADEVRISMTDFDDALQTLTIVKSTGNVAIEDLQAGVDVVINDVRGNVDIDFDNQNVPAALDLSINEFGYSAGRDEDFDPSMLTIDSAVETVNISDDATADNYYNNFMVEGGFSALNVTGGANGTDLTMGIASSADTLAVDFTGNESDAKDVFIDMNSGDGYGDPDQALTLTMGDYSDDVEIDSDFGDDIDADLGEGNNYLSMGEASNLTLVAGDGEDAINTSDISNYANIDLGNGDNYLSMGDVGNDYWWWYGGLDLVTGSGNDTVYTDDVGYADINLGEGTNYLNMNDVYSLDLITGSGNDTVYTDDVTYADINLGDGANYLNMNDVYSLDLITGSGNDTVYTDNVDYADINLGNGNNYIEMDYVGNVTLVTGDGADDVYIGGQEFWSGAYYYRDLNISLGGGDDFLSLEGNGLENSAGATDNHTIAGGAGNDTLRLYSLDEADAAGTFAHVTSIETLQLDSSYYGGALDGVTTGANAAGVVNYEFLYGNYYGEDITLTNVVNNVTVRMDLNEYWDAEGQNFTLTQTPDTSANVANVHFNLNDYYWWWSGNDYFFGDITVDTTEVLNLSGSDYWWWYNDEILQISGLNSDDLTTLNLSGDLGFNFWNIDAPNLSLVDATGMTAHAEIELNDVAAAITVNAGSGDDEIVLKDASSALTADGGAGDDYIEGNANDDVIRGGAGDDTLYAASGIDEVYGDAGDDLILWDAAELFAVDLIDGGADYDTVELTGSLGTQNDSFFYQWSDVERLDLDAGNNVLTLGIIASDAGLEEIHLSNTGAAGDSIYLVEGWTNDTAIHLSDGEDTVVEAPSVGIDLRVYADAGQVDEFDILTGANGDDTLFLTADGSTANLGGVTGFESVMVVANANSDIGITTAATTVASGATLTVDARALVDWDGIGAGVPGDLTFNGSAEVDPDGAGVLLAGNFVVYGGEGNDVITTGEGNDTINAGAGNNTVVAGIGNDSVTTGAGNDTITAGAGNDTINAGDGDNTVSGDAGNDSITTGAGNDTISGGDGNDTISAGTSYDTDSVLAGWQGNGNVITGGLGSDAMSGGAGVDTYVFAATDAQFGNADIITGFNAGGDGTLGQDLIETWAAVTYLGEYANATLGLLALQENVGGVEAVLVHELDGLYLVIDVNADDAYSSSDAAILLVGLTGTLDQTDFTVTV